MVDCRTQLASMAIEELDKGDFLMATKILTTGIRLEPNNHELYFERSICHHKLGDFKASLEDANTAIRLNPEDHNIHYNIHYQKGLALIGLSMFSEAVTSFKKAIELRAKQDDSKLSDIFKLLRDATNELNTARRRPGLTSSSTSTLTPTSNNHQVAPSQVIKPAGTGQLPGGCVSGGGSQGASSSNNSRNDPVDSTTDKPLIQPGTSNSNLNHMNHMNMNMTSSASSPLSSPAVENIIKNNGNNNLVAVNRNNNIINNNNNNNNFNNLQTNSNTTHQMINGNTANNRVSSSASHINSNLIHMPQINISPDMSGNNSVHARPNLGTTDLLLGNQSNQQQLIDQSKAAQFDWNIRRSERIFLHSNEPLLEGTGATQYGILTGHNEPLHATGACGATQRPKTGSNPSSVISGRSATKRPHEDGGETTAQQITYHQDKLTRSKDGTGSHVESDIVDVDDSSYNSQATLVSSNANELANRKRVLIAPSSSMPATSQQGPSSSTSKDDSYSSKYKRLRRDRERARRGTSKLCTIKPSDLDELHKTSSLDGGSTRHMRVIAPIDGWLYSGQLSIDESNGKKGLQQYVVKLDGDSTGSSYLFNQDTVLNDVIKEVRVKSVSELRKGARICCYWSRQYKCLSTGVVTSRTFEATKSLVSVKYDNGDLSALPLDDLRLLPPDYPKYMSNCDPLLLAKNGDGVHAPVVIPNINHESDRITIECKQATLDINPANGATVKNDADDTSRDDMDDFADRSSVSETIQEAIKITLADEEHTLNQDEGARLEHGDNVNQELGDDDDETIPPTDEVIDFITSESSLKLQDDNQHGTNDLVERISITKDNITTTTTTTTTTSETQINSGNSRASSEENNYGIEYCPWVFDGPPKRTKRHGRTYRDNYPRIRRGNEVIRVGDSAELMPRDESILPFIARIEGLWATSRGEMRVKVRWYYRLVETEGEPFELKDGQNALFETDHCDENDVQSIYRSTQILPWTDYCKNNLGHVNNNGDNAPKIFYLAGHYNPVLRVKRLMSDVKEAQ